MKLFASLPVMFSSASTMFSSTSTTFSLSRMISIMFICIGVLLTGCSSTQDEGQGFTGTERLPKDKLNPFPLPEGGETVRIKPGLPWEMWPLSRDLTGTPISDPTVLEADELIRVSRREEALRLYRHAVRKNLPDAQHAAVVIRLASTELSLDQPEQALKVLTDYFNSMQVREDQVDGMFSLLFAYAYARKGDLDQSLAWFSKIHRLTAGVGREADAAKNAVVMMLRALPTPTFSDLQKRWGGDAFINGLMGQEARRRRYPDFQEPSGVYVTRFWEMDAPSTIAGVDPYASDAQAHLGVLLPLSGKYSALGLNTRQGIELAFLGQQVGSSIVPLYRDTEGGLIEGATAFREITASGKTPVVIGPLISDVASAVADIARPNDISVFALSKRSSFVTGDGIYRLGPTVESQIQSLIEVASISKGYRRYAVVAPSSIVGDHYLSVFEQLTSQRSLNITFVGRYREGDDASLVSLINQLEVADFDAIFFPGSLDDASRFLTNIPYSKRREFPVIGPGTWYNPAEIARSRTVLEGVMFVSPFFAESQRDVVVRFNEAFQRKYGKKPDFLAAQGFDAATVVLSALKRTLQSDTTFTKALRQIELYEGLTGDIQLLPNGELKRSFAVVELFRGKLREVRPGESS